MTANSDLAVVFWLWKGWRAIYSHEHINTACRMLRDHMTATQRIICITDMPEGIDECETYPLWPDPVPRELIGPHRPNCYRRLRLFERGFIQNELKAKAVLHMDIDYVPMQSLDFLFPVVPFKITKGHYAVYNGSLWYMEADTHTHVWDNFNPRVSPKLVRGAKHPQRKSFRMIGSDQVWLSMQLPADTPTWGAADGVVAYARDSARYKSRKDAKLWLFPGGVKPWSAQCKQVLPAVYAKYMAYWDSPHPPTHGRQGIPA